MINLSHAERIRRLILAQDATWLLNWSRRNHLLTSLGPARLSVMGPGASISISCPAIPVYNDIEPAIGSDWSICPLGPGATLSEANPQRCPQDLLGETFDLSHGYYMIKIV